MTDFFICESGTPLLKFLLQKLEMFEFVICASSNRKDIKHAFPVFVRGRVKSSVSNVRSNTWEAF